MKNILALMYLMHVPPDPEFPREGAKPGMAYRLRILAIDDPEITQKLSGIDFGQISVIG